MTHGIELRKTSTDLDGRPYVEIVPVEGDYYFASSLTVHGAIDYAQSLGIPAEVWPTYIGLDDGDIDLDEVYDRCAKLKQRIAALTADELLAGNYFLKRVSEWLDAGQRFVITE